MITEKEARKILNLLEYFGHHFDFDDERKDEAIALFKNNNIVYNKIKIKILCKLFGHKWEDKALFISKYNSLDHVNVRECEKCKILRATICDCYTGEVYGESLYQNKEEFNKAKVNILNEVFQLK